MPRGWGLHVGATGVGWGHLCVPGGLLPTAASPLGAQLAGRGAATPWWTLPTPLQPPWSPLPDHDAHRSTFPTGSFIFCTCCVEPRGGSFGRRMGLGVVSRGHSGARLAVGRMASLLQCYCRQGPVTGQRLAAPPLPPWAGTMRGLLALLGHSRGAFDLVLGVTSGQEQGRAGAGVPLLAHEGEHPGGRDRVSATGPPPAPYRAWSLPHRFLVSGGMTASARRFL